MSQTDDSPSWYMYIKKWNDAYDQCDGRGAVGAFAAPREPAWAAPSIGGAYPARLHWDTRE